LMLVSGIFLLYRVIIELQEIEDPYNFKNRPISIAIAGDSGVGKDRLTSALSFIVGERNSTILLGDDYHIAERGDAIWKKFTHLNPRANNLLKFNNDFNKSLSRIKYGNKHYDHSSGKFTSVRQIETSNFLIVNALHALLLPDITKVDFKVFMSMDESLRKKFKIHRDSKSRNYTSTKSVQEIIKSRVQDSDKFIKGQVLFSDLHIHTSWDGKSIKSIKYLLKSEDLNLMEKIYRDLMIYVPNVIYFNSQHYQLELYLKDLLEVRNFQVKSIYENAIVDYDNFVLNPIFENPEIDILCLIVLIGTSRKRLLKNAN